MTGKSSRSTSALVYYALMAALGTALAILSINLVQLWHTQIALDLGHVGTFLAAIPGGPLGGFVTGLIVGFYPGIAFGYIWGTLGIVGLVSLPLGKGMTGLCCGVLQRYLKRPFLSVIIGYVPESLFTLGLFLYIVPALNLIPPPFHLLLGFEIVVKAWLEILFMAFVMETVFLSSGIVQLLKRIFPDWDYTPLSEL